MEIPAHSYDEDSSELKNVALGLIAIANEIRILTFGNASGIKMGAIEGLTVKVCECLNELNESVSKVSKDSST